MRKTEIAQDINPELLKQSDEDYSDEDESSNTQSECESEHESSTNLFKNLFKAQTKEQFGTNVKEVRKKLMDYRGWTLRSQIVCSSCASLTIVALIFILTGIVSDIQSIFNFKFVYTQFSIGQVDTVINANIKNIEQIMRRTTTHNLNDLCNQTDLNYQMFFNQVLTKSLNVTHNVVWNITFPERSQYNGNYPLNWKSITVSSKSFYQYAIE